MARKTRRLLTSSSNDAEFTGCMITRVIRRADRDRDTGLRGFEPCEPAEGTTLPGARWRDRAAWPAAPARRWARRQRPPAGRRCAQRQRAGGADLIDEGRARVSSTAPTTPIATPRIERRSP